MRVRRTWPSAVLPGSDHTAFGDMRHNLTCVTSKRDFQSTPASSSNPREIVMAKGEQKGNREVKKPKKEKIKTIAAAPSQKTAGWQPAIGGTGKKK
jgi:hypothetical protein